MIQTTPRCGPVLGGLLALTFTAAATAAIPPSLELSPFAEGFTTPVAVRAAADGSGRVYVVESNGRIRTLNRDGMLIGTLLDLVANPPPLGLSTGGERGLLGLAFHPNPGESLDFFVYYTDAQGDSVVTRYETTGSPPVAVVGSATVVLRVEQDFSNHNGGDLHFGPDGFLYIALGDGGSGGDPCSRAQTRSPDDLVLSGICASNPGFTGDADSLALLGKVVRIDVDASTPAGANGLCGGAADGSAAYAIPSGNPWAGGGTGNGCDETLHLGLRNPYRFSLDRSTGDLYLGDVGQNSWEEVSRAGAAETAINFGWDLCEGNHPYPPAAGPCTLAGARLPIAEYPTSALDRSVVGGYVYRGARLPALNGDYFFGDFFSGKIWIAAGSGQSWTAQLWRDLAINVAGFGEDETGELYVVDYGGAVLKFTSADDIFADGFE